MVSTAALDELEVPGDDSSPEEIQAYREAMAKRNAGADDTAKPNEKVQTDYFGFEETENVYLDDGVSFVTIQAFNEGSKRDYLNKVNREVTIDKRTENISTRLQPGDERFVLLKAAIVGWNLVTKNGKGELQPLGFNDSALRKFLENANPRIIDPIEKAVRKQNAWLLKDLSADDMRKEINDLEELLAKKLEEEEGKASSSSK